MFYDLNLTCIHPGTEERQALLKDYGFICQCSLCQQDRGSQEEPSQYCSPCV